MWEELARESVGDWANAKTKEDPIRDNQDHRQVVQVWMVGGQLKIAVEAQEDHVDGNHETANHKLGTTVDPWHDKWRKDHSDGERGLEEDGKDGGGEGDPREDEEGESVIGENVSSNRGVHGEEDG